MSENGFIFLLSLGATLLGGILTVVHISAYRLSQRRQNKLQKQLAPAFGSPIEPELELGDVIDLDDPHPGYVAVQIRHPETTR